MFTWSPSTSSTTLQSIKSLSPSTSSFGRTLLENLTRSPLYHSLTSLDKTKLWSKFYVNDEQNIQKVLDAVSVDQKVITNPRANRRRRAVMVTRNDGQPFGFTLQTYLLIRKGEEVPSKVTYVDYVHLDSPAADAGIRAGDVIISINGRVVTEMSHEALIELIASCRQMRMVVIFENIRQRIELVARAIKLRKILNDKLYQLNLIDIEEQKILNKAYLRSMTRKAKHSLANSLSSAGTSSASSVSSAPSDGSGITSDAERRIIRIPTIIAPTNEKGIEIHKFPLKRPTLERSCYLEVSSSRRSTKLPPDSGRTKVMDTGMELLAIQRIRCFGSDWNVYDSVSLNSCDTGQVSNTAAIHAITCDTVDGGIDNADNSSSVATGCGSDNAVDDNDVENDGDDIDDDNSVVLSEEAAASTTATTLPKSEAVFDSIALNHVIRLDDDIISSDSDERDQIRVLKL